MAGSQRNRNVFKTNLGMADYETERWVALSMGELKHLHGNPTEAKRRGRELA